MKKINLIFSSAIVLMMLSCGPSAEEQKAKENQIADSVAKALTGKEMNDPENQAKIEKVKADSVEKANTKPADAMALKSIAVDYDFDNKLFNKKSDIDGHIYNNSSTHSFKNFVMRVTGKDKNGNTTESFVRTIHSYLGPHASTKFTIRFSDSNKTKTASLVLIGAEQI